DFQGTLKKMAEIGYKSCELCSPFSYGEFKGAAKYKGAELRRIIEDAGLKCVSCHFGPADVSDKNLEERIAWSKDLGLTQMILAAFGLGRNPTLADWKRAADNLNKAGETVKNAGLQLGYHNHDMEFEKLDGVLVYDELMKTFDPKVIKMQFQVAVIAKGYKAEDYMKKYSGRIISLHLADWSPTEKKMVPIGKGVVDWKALFQTAKTTGLKNYFVEVEDKDSTQLSYPFLHNLKV
ncbi:MAG TPA: sugar phosphate isomerase/epimerase family protein, partial [Bryobacteraceae bacterium]|nr:sugar phosphate isomerase/epimerase family protein [Bryobacteraceae bacterium]